MKTRVTTPGLAAIRLAMGCARVAPVLLVLLISACATAELQTPHASPDTTDAVASESPHGTSRPATSSATPSTEPSGPIPIGALVQATAGDLRVRVSPELDAEPLTNLAAGQRVRVTDGPQDGDGHRWYEVTLLPSNVVGWVAASGADGVPWLAVVGNGGLALASGASVSELDVREESRRPVAELAAGWTASQPSWSPDGDRLAVAELDFDDSLQCVLGGRVVIFDAAGTVVTRTSPPPGTYDSAPIWAPDEGAIGFMRSNACGSDQGLPALHVVAADGGPDRLIVENAIGPTWSPVGDTFAFLRLSGEQTGIPGDLRGPEIWTVAADGTGLRRLGGRADISGERERLSDRLAWAPDASLLAFSRAVGPELADVEIDVMDLEGQVRRVATVPGEVRDLTWLPDGSGLVYIEGRFLATAVVVLTPDGRETARFELTDGVPDRLIVAPDGTSLAWRIQGSALLRVQPLDGSPILIDEVEATDIAWRSVLITD